jgi:iron complex transport system ATP-binding protein
VIGIEVTSLTVRAGARSLLDNVTLTIPAGTWHTVIGPNGAGKTTLVEAVAGVRRVSCGHVKLGERSVSAMHDRERAKTVAFVPQHPLFPVGMSVHDYVALGRVAHHGVLGTLDAVGREKVASMITRVELDSFIERDVTTLSGGERQRVVLARALTQEAPVLVLDEPTTGLDLRHQIEALELIRREVDDRQLTVIATLHDLTLAGQFADALALLHEGRLVCHDAASVVVRSPQLADAYGMALRVLEVDGRDVVVPATVAGRNTAV